MVVAMLFAGAAHDTHQNSSAGSQDWDAHLARLSQRLPIGDMPAVADEPGLPPVRVFQPATEPRPMLSASTYRSIDALLVERVKNHLLTKVAVRQDTTAALYRFITDDLAVILAQCQEYQHNTYYRARFLLRLYACLAYLCDRVGRELRRNGFELQIMEYLEEHGVDPGLPFELLRGLTINKAWQLTKGIHLQVGPDAQALHSDTSGLLYPAVEQRYIDKMRIVVYVSQTGTMRTDTETVDLASFKTELTPEQVTYLYHILGEQYDQKFAGDHDSGTRNKWHSVLDKWFEELIELYGVPGTDQMGLEPGSRGRRYIKEGRFPKLESGCPSGLQLRQDDRVMDSGL